MEHDSLVKEYTFIQNGKMTTFHNSNDMLHKNDVLITQEAR